MEAQLLLDPDGRDILTAIAIGAAVGAAIGAGASMAVQAVQRGEDWWRINRTDGSSVVKSAIVGGIAGAASGGLAGYSAGVWASNDFESIRGWDAKNAAKVTASGAAIGGVMGGMGGGYAYNQWVSNAARNSANSLQANNNATAKTSVEHGSQHDLIKGTGGGFDIKPGENGTSIKIEFSMQNEYTVAFDHSEPIPFNPMKTDLVSNVSPFEYHGSNFWKFDQIALDQGRSSPYQFLSNRGSSGWETRVFLEGKQVGSTMYNGQGVYKAFKDIYWRW